MTTASRTSPGPSRSSTQELDDFVAELMLDPDREPVTSEIRVLQSIYGEDAIQLWRPNPSHRRGDNDGTIRYEVLLCLPAPHDDIGIRVLVSLSPSYPATSPPQLQLLSRYIGAFGADHDLFGCVLRTFISVNGVDWVSEVCVFDGLQNVIERCLAWYEDRISAEKAGELVREEARDHVDLQSKLTEPEEPERAASLNQSFVMPDGVDLVQAEAITDRKSVFVGRACRISHPSQVPMVLSHLMSDRQISRAAHPIINAWRCQVGSLLHQDNDDDGETAAGGRLAHLLQILEVNNVLVVVTRYFGGIHLGPDRFKHINQAARNALELGGFLDTMEVKKNNGRVKRH